MLHIHRNVDGTYYIEICLEYGSGEFRFSGSFAHVSDEAGEIAMDEKKFIVNIPIIINDK